MNGKKPYAKIPPIEEFKTLTFNQATGQVNHLRGKILTIIDSLGLEEGRTKAIKDLVHNEFGECNNIFWRHGIGEQVFPKG